MISVILDKGYTHFALAAKNTDPGSYQSDLVSKRQKLCRDFVKDVNVMVGRGYVIISTMTDESPSGIEVVKPINVSYKFDWVQKMLYHLSNIIKLPEYTIDGDYKFMRGDLIGICDRLIKDFYYKDDNLCVVGYDIIKNGKKIISHGVTIGQKYKLKFTPSTYLEFTMSGKYAYQSDELDNTTYYSRFLNIVEVEALFLRDENGFIRLNPDLMSNAHSYSYYDILPDMIRAGMIRDSSGFVRKVKTSSISLTRIIEILSCLNIKLPETPSVSIHNEHYIKISDLQVFNFPFDILIFSLDFKDGVTTLTPYASCVRNNKDLKVYQSTYFRLDSNSNTYSQDTLTAINGVLSKSDLSYKDSADFQYILGDYRQSIKDNTILFLKRILEARAQSNLLIKDYTSKLIKFKADKLKTNYRILSFTKEMLDNMMSSNWSDTPLSQFKFITLYEVIFSTRNSPWNKNNIIISDEGRKYILSNPWDTKFYKISNYNEYSHLNPTWDASLNDSNMLPLGSIPITSYISPDFQSDIISCYWKYPTLTDDFKMFKWKILGTTADATNFKTAVKTIFPINKENPEGMGPPLHFSIERIIEGSNPSYFLTVQYHYGYVKDLSPASTNLSIITEKLVEPLSYINIERRLISSFPDYLINIIDVYGRSTSNDDVAIQLVLED